MKEEINSKNIRAGIILQYVQLIVNVLISIFLIKTFGILGASIGTSVSIFVSTTIIMNIYYQKAIKLDMKNFLLNIIKSALGFIMTIIFGILILYFIEIKTVINLILLIVAYTLVVSVSVYFISFNKFEKSLVIGVLMKIKNIFISKKKLKE